MRFLTLFLVLCFSTSIAQDTDRKIQFPDIEGYKSLKCDLHIHTVFSDGHVWPNIRIEEALKDGLDAISLTEHIEYQPWKKDIPHPDRNRSYELAKEYSKAHDLIIIHGAEITRNLPVGHANALFINDANKLMIEDAEEAYTEARNQGAFVFWNHPNWVNQEKDGIPQLSDFHKKMIRSNRLHGIEAVNDVTYSEEALQIAIDHNLTVIGTSDIHGLIDWQFELAEGGHRPINLVFAVDKSEASIKEALFAGRTLSWYQNILIGKEQWMNALLDASISFERKGMIGPSSILEISLTNHSDARFILKNNSAFDFYKSADLIELEPHSTITLNVLTDRVEGELPPLSFDVLNAVIGFKKNASIQFGLGAR